jgi:hypothetical protein
MDVVNIVQIVTQGGAVALLAIILFGGWSMIPAVKEFLLSLTAAMGDIKSRIAVIETKQDATNAKIDGATGAILKTGDATVATLGRLSDIAHEDAAHNDEALAGLERRLAAAIRRELSSDPPGPASRPSLNTPATGLPRVSRVG